MNPKFTSEDIIRFLYGEMDQPERDLFLDTMLQDEGLFSEFESLKASHAALTPVQLTPSRKSTDRILHASRRATKESRKPERPFGPWGSRKMRGIHHTGSVLMVFFTCLMACAAMYAYIRVTSADQAWEMTQTKGAFMDVDLDNRLDGARQRLEGMLEDREEVIVPVHHSTYRVMEAPLQESRTQEVKILHIK